MNELRLEYHQETGIRIHDRIDHNGDEYVKEYIEWLEEQITG